MRHRTQVLDPFKLAKMCWPHVRFYSKQREIIRSVEENDETFVSAGNMLGKDFVAGFIALWFFLSRHPCRVVTTSADGPQLEAVLWGEIRRFIQTSVVPLEGEKGGPLVVNHLHLRKLDPGTGKVCGISYVIGRVAAKGEGMLGHHVAETGDGVPRTLFVADEASGVDDQSYKASDTWARRKLVIGNPWPCNNFFKSGIKGGDLYAKE
jgi:phage terminase large subunit